MSLNASEASTQNDTQRHQPPFTAKRTTVTTDRKADAEASHRRCSSQDNTLAEISQRGASAIAAHCISHRSALHQHLQRTAPGTPAICHTHRTRYPETAQQACRPQPPSFQTIADSSSAPPITFQAHPSPTAQQSPPLSYFHTKPSLITTHQRQIPNPELSLYIPTTPLPYTHNGNPLSLSCTTARHSPQKKRP